MVLVKSAITTMFILYVGGYDNQLSVLNFNPATGILEAPCNQIAADASSWLLRHNAGVGNQRLYVAHEKEEGQVSVLTVTKPTKGEILQSRKNANSSSPSSCIQLTVEAGQGNNSNLTTVPTGNGPVYLALSKDQTRLFVPNYGGGTVSQILLEQGTGLISKAPNLKDKSAGDFEDFVMMNKPAQTGPNKERQDKPHPHGTYLDYTGQYLFVPDLGTDSIHVFDVEPKDDGSSQLSNLHSGWKVDLPVLPAGSGPRHLTFGSSTNDKKKVLMYHANELASTLHVYEVVYPTMTIEGKTEMTFKLLTNMTTVEPGKEGENWTAAEISFTPDRKFLLISNRVSESEQKKSGVEDQMTILKIDPTTGLPIGKTTYQSLHGIGPRHFAFSKGTSSSSTSPSTSTSTSMNEYFLAVTLTVSEKIVIFKCGATDKGELACDFSSEQKIPRPAVAIWETENL